MEYYRDLKGNQVQLTFEPTEFEDARHVLILPFYRDALVFARHRLRGIELPGGKVEAGETALAAAVREVYEEIGAALTEIRLIGQYIVDLPEGRMVKSIYVAQVETLHSIVFESDSDGPIWFEQLPFDIQKNPAFSDYMKDEVYPRTLQFIGLL